MSKRLAVTLTAVLSLFVPPVAQGQERSALSQDACLREYRQCTRDIEAARTAGNPILEREAKAKLDAFYANTVVNGRAVNDWFGVLRQMDLDQSGRIVFCAVDVGLGTDLPPIAVTNYDISSGKTVPGSLDVYRDLGVGDRIRFSGTLRKPVRLADYLKLIPGAELAFGDMNEWGVVATSLGKVVPSPASRRFLQSIEAVPDSVATLRSILEECLTLKSSIEELTDDRTTLHVWREVSKDDPDFREAYDHLVGLPFPAARPASTDPYDYIRNAGVKVKHLTLRAPDIDEDLLASTLAGAEDVKPLVEVRGDLPLDDDQVRDLQRRIRRLDDVRAPLGLYRDHAQIILDQLTGTERPVPRTPRGEGEPDRVTAQMLLIAFTGSKHAMRPPQPPNTVKRAGRQFWNKVRGGLNLTPVQDAPLPTRTEDEARVAATELFERAKAGEGFSSLVSDFSDDDQPNGLYVFVNDDIWAESWEAPRRRLHPALADAVFHLKLDEVALVPYHRKKSPWGWTILKRVK